jgi:hypothetical protein
MAGLIGVLSPLQSIGTRAHEVDDLVAAWPDLPEAIKAGILAMVKAAAK